MKAALINTAWLLPLELSGCLQTNRHGIRADAQACGQSLMYKPRFREKFREVPGLQWGVLRAETEAQHFLTRSLQQLYTVRILSRRLIDSTRLLPVVWKDESRKRADESW